MLGSTLVRGLDPLNGPGKNETKIPNTKHSKFVRCDQLRSCAGSNRVGAGNCVRGWRRAGAMRCAAGQRIAGRVGQLKSRRPRRVPAERLALNRIAGALKFQHLIFERLVLAAD